MEIERFMNHQGMELNALYQQDIDLGVNWPLFEPVKQAKEIDLPQKFGFDPQNFIVDGETGEFLPIPQNNNGDVVNNQNQIPGNEFNIDAFLESNIVTQTQSIQLVQSDNADTINKELWDDIATLSEAYLALDSGECAKQEMSASPLTENVPFQPNAYHSDVYHSSPQMQIPEQKALPKEQFGNMPYHNFPTPPYSEQSDSTTRYTHHPNVAFSPEPSKPFSPADLEGVKLAEMMMTQQQNDLLSQLDNVANVNVGNPNPPPILNANDVTAPGGWFLDGDEPATNLTDVLVELDIMNNMQTQAGPYMNPSTAPYVPPPITTIDAVSQGGISLGSEPESLDSGYADNVMDIDVHDISNTDVTAALTPEQNQEMTRKQKLRESRDEKKARELNIGLTMGQIINTPVEEYNELLNRANLNSEQQSLVRDIRRRGKNKVAAQNCRKRKIETISSMELDIEDLNTKRRELMNRQRELEDTKKGIQAKYNQLYQQIFTSLRDESGRPYDQSRYSLQQVEGAIILVPGIFGATNTHKSESKSSVAFFDLSKVKIEKEI